MRLLICFNRHLRSEGTGNFNIIIACPAPGSILDFSSPIRDITQRSCSPERRATASPPLPPLPYLSKVGAGQRLKLTDKDMRRQERSTSMLRGVAPRLGTGVNSVYCCSLVNAAHFWSIWKWRPCDCGFETGSSLSGREDPELFVPPSLKKSRKIRDENPPSPMAFSNGIDSPPMSPIRKAPIQGGEDLLSSVE